jgi:hypothetical protein
MLMTLGLLAVASVTLVAAGCGGGSKSTSGTTTEATTTQAATTTEAATTEAATTQTATTTPAPPTTPNLDGLSSKCKDIVNLGTQLATAVQGLSTGSAAASAAALKKEAQVLAQFAAKAPSDISGDFKVAAEYVSKVGDIAGSLKQGQVPDAATLAKIQSLSTDATKWSTAWTHISTWMAANCHA